MRKRINLQNQVTKMTFDSAFEQMQRIKKSQNLADETITYYENVRKSFIDFWPGDNLCEEITKETVEDYIHFLKSKTPPISSITINSYLRGLRTILYFFMEHGYTRDFKISLIRAEKAVKITYTDEELNSILRKPNVKSCDFTEYRNWVISNYLLATGNRLSTICNIKIRDIDFQNNEILLTKVKNRRQHIIPLSAKLSKILIDYLQYRKGEKDDYLFCNRYGEQLNKSAFTSAIKRYNRSRGVEKTSIHLYRHTFAKNWILNGGDIFRLQSILGHSSIDIVKEYVEMFGSDLKNNFDRFNPLDNFSGASTRGASMKMEKS